MTSNTVYNGYSNYQTWATYNWLVLNDDFCTYCTQEVKAVKQCSINGKEEERVWLGDKLKIWVTRKKPKFDNLCLYTDLLDEALEQINWDEIADKFLE